MVMAPPPTRDSAILPCFHGYLAFFHLISHHDLLPHIPSIHLFVVNSTPHPGIAPQSLTPAPSCCSFQETPVTAQGIQGCGKDYLILIPFRLPQISCFTRSLKCFSSDSDNYSAVGVGLLLHFPHLPSAGPVLLTLLFIPQFLHHTEFCVVLYILFHWSGTPVCSQLVFCMHFCV